MSNPIRYVPRNLRDDGMIPADESTTHKGLQRYVRAEEIERLKLENERLWSEQYNYPHRIDEQDEEIKRLLIRIDAAHDELMNLQPHIPQSCYPGREGFIDNYVDQAMRILKGTDEEGQMQECEHGYWVDTQNCPDCGRAVEGPEK